MFRRRQWTICPNRHLLITARKGQQDIAPGKVPGFNLFKTTAVAEITGMPFSCRFGSFAGLGSEHSCQLYSGQDCEVRLYSRLGETDCPGTGRAGCQKLIGNRFQGLRSRLTSKNKGGQPWKIEISLFT
jgi:hypothetical protein